MSITPSVAFDTVKKSSMPVSNGKTLYVGGSGGGNYTTIQEAIDNASYGDTVFVYNGKYYENVVINQYGIRLIGEDKEITIIDGGGNNSVILIDAHANGVTVSEFTIQNSVSWDTAGGIEINSEYNIITKNIIRNNPKNGILVYDYEMPILANNITQNIIIDNECGINLGYSYPNDIYENYIVNNSVGIYAGVTFCKSSLTYGDVFPSLSWKSLILYNLENHIFRNMIKNNGWGISLEGGYYTYIYENNIIENDLGIRLEAPFNGYCKENYIYQNNITNNNFGIIISQHIGLYGRDGPRDNEIYTNNFINNRKNAHINGYNKWEANYWDDWIGVKIKLPIFQRFPKILLDRFRLTFDWHPAKEPYDIEVVI